VKNIAYLITLQLIDGLGSARLKMLLDFYKDPACLWQISISELKEFKLPQNVIKSFEKGRQTLDPDKEFQKVKDYGIQVVSLYDKNYPEILKQIYQPPVLLYFVGEIPDLNCSIGIVGTRQVTGYGSLVTKSLTEGLVNRGFCIISGLARGVDTIAHQTAIEFGGKTIAVLGGGLNNIFPRENIALAQKIARTFGAVVSEYHPDAPSLPGNFPARNRIISGLSQAVLVTEAAKGSGSLITAQSALEQGKTVYAVPGPINSVLSEGPLELIRDGAKLVTKTEDIVEDFGHLSEIKPARAVNSLNRLEYQIITELSKEKKHLDELTRLLGLPPAKIASSLLKLEIEGFVSSEGNGVYVKNL
jgi:DNA processing protein